MVTGGNATVFITNMDAAISFYTGVLGMKLIENYGDAWATLQAGDFTIGLHPKSDKAPPPGTSGSIQIGLMMDDIQSGRERLAASSAKHVAEIEGGDGGSFLHFQDPDGNDLYLWQMPKWG
jgi:predicted enzyme related to lactoylglutathione lyase